MLKELYNFSDNLPGQLTIEMPEADVMRHADRALKTLQSFYEADENRSLIFGESDDIFSCGSPKELPIEYLKPILTLSMHNKCTNDCNDSHIARCGKDISSQCEEESNSVINQLEKNGVKTLYFFYQWLEGGFLDNFNIDRESMACLNKVKIWLDKGDFEACQGENESVFGGPAIA